MTDNELKAVGFLKQQLWKNEEIKDDSKIYRYEHSLRVAAVGRKIAEAEGLDIEALSLGCILHDVGTFDSLESPMDHGRVSARIAREFLNTLDLTSATIEEICYGIAIHVDGKADYDGIGTVLCESISDSDNIDRFDAYRIFDNLQYQRFNEMTLNEQLEHVNITLSKLKRLLEMKFATSTATELWVDRLYFQIKFFERLKSQLESGFILHD